MLEWLKDWVLVPQLVTALSVGFLVGRLYGKRLGRRDTLGKADRSRTGIVGWNHGGRSYVVMTQEGAERIGWRFGDFLPDKTRHLAVPVPETAPAARDDKARWN